MNAFVIYKSKHGTTKQYAEWIAEELHTRAACVDDVTDEDIKKHDTILLGSSVYASNIIIRPFLEHKWPLLEKKKLILFAVGKIPKDAVASVEGYERIPVVIRSHLIYFKLKGEIRWEKLDWWEKLIVWLIAKDDGSRITRDEIQKVVTYAKTPT
jgi:ADP-ribose pyrophosphatase